ncbi:MAG: hypothetical protein JWM25_1018 [Thermoleophilia bacterium]|nr:hypothetical protein [Thermoleophilia bacterium]MCZ4496435.1 hypothetical protein [Thermoleophilia bacterium]
MTRVITVDHPRKPVRLDGGELLPHPDSLAANCLVWFPVPDATEGGPEAEGVPALRLDGDRARLTGIPFFPYHAGAGDEVQVREQDGTLYAVEVVAATSDLVVRVFDHDAQVDTEQALTDPQSDEPFWRIARALAPHGVWFERYSSSYAALQVTQPEWEYVRAFLDLRSRAEGLQWELATPMRDADHP